MMDLFLPHSDAFSVNRNRESAFINRDQLDECAQCIVVKIECCLILLDRKNRHLKIKHLLLVTVPQK